MDEPTNDLDIETLELLEERLMAYQGTVLLISHDRAFLDNVVTDTWAFMGDGVVEEFVGGYQDWLRQTENRQNKANLKATKTAEKTHHAARLLSEVIQNSPMGKTMVAAYTLGWPYNPKEVGFPVCKSPTATGCLINWNTYLWDKKPSRLEELYKNGFCVNPLSWSEDTLYMPKESNLGSLPKSYDSIIPQIADAKCEEGILWTHKVPEKDFPTLELGKNYHLVDYQLFYKNIRENATLRVKTYLGK